MSPNEAERLLGALSKLQVRLWVDDGQLYFKAPRGSLSAAIKAKIRHLKPAMISLLEKRDCKDGKLDYRPPLRPQDKLPLSFAQQRFWYIDRMIPKQATYNVPEVVRLTGDLDVPALACALSDLVTRHEVFRTRLLEQDQQLNQCIVDAIDFALQRTDLSAADPQQQQMQLQSCIEQEIDEPFNLSVAPLFRARLVRLATDTHVLILVMHHVVADDRSIEILRQELSIYYLAAHQGIESSLPKLSLQYADFSLWQRQQDAAPSATIDYWRRQLAGLTTLQLPADYPRPALPSYRGEWLEFDLSKSLVEKLRRLGRDNGASLNMTLLTVFKVLLMRYSGQTDIAVGSPVSERKHKQLQGVMGCFINTLVLRTQLSGNPTFRRVLERVRSTTLDAYEHGDVPFEHLVEILNVSRDPGRMPLFQVFFSFTAMTERDEAGFNLPGLKVSAERFNLRTSKFDLNLMLTESADGVHGRMEYALDLFEKSRIAQLLMHFRKLLVAVTADPEQCIWQLALLGKVERRQQLVVWNDTRSEYPPNACIHQLFREQVRRTPELTAVISGDQRLSYAELDNRAGQLAQHLRDVGVTTGALVGLCLERSTQMLVGLLAILKAGAAWLALDPVYPEARLRLMINDSGISILITQSSLQMRLPQTGISLIRMDVDTWECTKNAQPLAQYPRADDLAYVAYTSGSTGCPRGIAQTHRMLTNLICWQMDQSNLEVGASTLQFAALGFDVSAQEIFSTLCAGGRLVMLPETLRANSTALAAHIQEYAVERVYLPFVALQQIAVVLADKIDPRFPVREWVTAGEQLQITSEIRCLFRNLPGAVLRNQYGPTETHVVTCCTLQGEPLSWPALPAIGQPIANTQVYVLDEYRQLLPIGVAGELYIGGDGLAQGYWQNHQLTSERFIVSPFDARSRLYRTGDRVRYTANGDIKFLGRYDHQFKLRGYRIEPGEIENTIRVYGDIREVVVMIREDKLELKYIAAYFVPMHGDFDLVTLRSWLSKRLPDYMVPSAFMQMDSLPVTPNGKLDRGALPVAELNRGTVIVDYIAPRTPEEIIIAEMWTELLGLKEPPGVYDDFFGIGGHSLLATQVINRMMSIFGNVTDLLQFFADPSISGLATSVLKNDGAASLPPIERRKR